MVDSGKRFEMRVDEELLERVDAWRANEDDLPNRSEAVRRLAERGLRGAREMFSPGEKMIILALNELATKLKVPLTDVDLPLAADVIHGGRDWALRLAFSGVFHNHQDDPENVDLVMNVLSMWEEIEQSYQALSSTQQAALAEELGHAGKNPRFYGFDGNEEAEYLGIAGFLIKKLDRFQHFAGRKLNSHMPVLSTYRQMLEVFERVRRHDTGGPGLHWGDLQKVLAAKD